MNTSTPREKLKKRLLDDLGIRICGDITFRRRGYHQRTGGVMAWEGKEASGRTINSEDTITQCVKAKRLTLRQPPQTWWGIWYVDALN